MVADTADLGAGFPDAVVGYRNYNWLIEIKDPAKPPSARKLTAAEVRFHDNWTGQVDVIMTVDEVLSLIEYQGALF